MDGNIFNFHGIRLRSKLYLLLNLIIVVTYKVQKRIFLTKLFSTIGSRRSVGFNIGYENFQIWEIMNQNFIIT